MPMPILILVADVVFKAAAKLDLLLVELVEKSLPFLRGGWRPGLIARKLFIRR
jgi:hypothetical protein